MHGYSRRNDQIWNHQHYCHGYVLKIHSIDVVITYTHHVVCEFTVQKYCNVFFRFLSTFLASLFRLGAACQVVLLYDLVLDGFKTNKNNVEIGEWCVSFPKWWLIILWTNHYTNGLCKSAVFYYSINPFNSNNYNYHCKNGVYSSYKNGPSEFPSLKPSQRGERHVGCLRFGAMKLWASCESISAVDRKTSAKNGTRPCWSQMSILKS